MTARAFDDRESEQSTPNLHSQWRDRSKALCGK